jgi:heptosyltransferase-2
VGATDVLLAGAAGQALVQARPDLRVTFLVKSEYAALVEGQPWVHDVWALGPGEERAAAGLAKWRARIRDAEFGAVVDLQTSPRSRALLAGHPRRLSWRAERFARRRWVSLRWTHPAAVTPAWRRLVAAVAPLGVDPTTAAPPRHIPSAGARARANAFIEAWSTSGPIVFLAPGARWQTKRWPEESYKALGEHLVAAGARVLIGGDRADRDALPALSTWADAAPAVRWFEGSLADLAAVVEHAKGAVTNDTGLMHLAAAVEVPVVAVFGSTHPALGFAPAGSGHRVLCAGLSCQPCTLHGRERCPLGHHRCVHAFKPSDVLAALGAAAPELAREVSQAKGD